MSFVEKNLTNISLLWLVSVEEEMLGGLCFISYSIGVLLYVLVKYKWGKWNEQWINYKVWAIGFVCSVNSLDPELAASWSIQKTKLLFFIFFL